MSDKPSLYVVEKKEVVILVVLFVLVTVLAFTTGVKYGESVGKKAAQDQLAAEAEVSTGPAERLGGKLEEVPDTSRTPAPAEPARESAPPSKEAVDRDSDEFLLNALKEAGVEPPGGKAPGDAKLPQEVKRVQSGNHVVQVGSHPTRSEAEAQVRQLKARNVEAEILPPFKDKQGQWHRVVVGSYKTRREAEKEANALKSRGVIVSFFIWRMP